MPAITGAGLEDYRVDRDPTAHILIDAIEEGISSSDACIAEITTDNPNVWYELGFAIANGKPLVMISNSSERHGPFPFDVSHRHVIAYKPESPRDFAALQAEITRRLKALIEVDTEAKTIASIASSGQIGGLSPHELAALQIIAEDQLSVNDTVSATSVREQMVQAGFSKIAATLSLRMLERREYIEAIDEGFGNQVWWCYRATSSGLDWLLSHQDLFPLREQPNTRALFAPSKQPDRDYAQGVTDDDVPF